jgi:hypothetical protein
LLRHVHELAAAVITLAGIALRILVGELGTLRLHHRRAGVILRRDQLDMLFLAAGLVLDGLPEFGIHGGECSGSVEHVQCAPAAAVAAPPV